VLWRGRDGQVEEIFQQTEGKRRVPHFQYRHRSIRRETMENRKSMGRGELPPRMQKHSDWTASFPRPGGTILKTHIRRASKTVQFQQSHPSGVRSYSKETGETPSHDSVGGHRPSRPPSSGYRHPLISRESCPESAEGKGAAYKRAS